MRHLNKQFPSLMNAVDDQRHQKLFSFISNGGVISISLMQSIRVATVSHKALVKIGGPFSKLILMHSTFTVIVRTLFATCTAVFRIVFAIFSVLLHIDWSISNIWYDILWLPLLTTR